MRQTMKCEFESQFASREAAAAGHRKNNNNTAVAAAATIFDYPMGLSVSQSGRQDRVGQDRQGRTEQSRARQDRGVSAISSC